MGLFKRNESARNESDTFGSAPSADCGVSCPLRPTRLRNPRACTGTNGKRTTLRGVECGGGKREDAARGRRHRTRALHSPVAPAAGDSWIFGPATGCGASAPGAWVMVPRPARPTAELPCDLHNAAAQCLPGNRPSGGVWLTMVQFRGQRPVPVPPTARRSSGICWSQRICANSDCERVGKSM